MSPRQTSHQGRALFICSRRSASLSQGRPPGWLWTSATISPCISARSQSSGAIRKYASGSAEIFTHGWYRSPSGVLITKPQDSAGAHRRACARIADSVSVMDLLRKFINGKETAKISHHAAHLTPAHALAASVLTDIRGGVVELIRHRRTVIPAFISPVIPHTGVRQHDATRKQRPVRLRRCCQHKRGCHGRQL